MSKKISRVELIKSLGDESDLDIVSIDNIRIFDEDEEQILDNDFITNYNHNSTNFFYQEDDSEKYNQIITEIADKLNVSKEIIDESFSEQKSTKLNSFILLF